MNEYDSLTQSASGNTEMANSKVIPGSAPWTDKLREVPIGKSLSVDTEIENLTSQQSSALLQLEGLWIGF